MIHALNAILAVALIAGSVAGWFALPDTIPTHFDLGGRPDAWSERSLLTWFGPAAIGAALAAGMYLLGRWVPRKPEWFNFPGKDRYFALAPADRRPVDEALAGILHHAAAVVLVVFVLVQALVLAEATGRGTTGLTVALLVVAVAGGPVSAAVGVIRIQRAMDAAWARHRARGGEASATEVSRPPPRAGPGPRG